MKWVKNIFENKREKEMQRRAEESRKIRDIETRFEETHRDLDTGHDSNIENLFDEIRNKKKASK